MSKNNFLKLIINPVFIVIFLFLIFVLVASYPYLSYDEALWTYIGRLWNSHGIPPYIGAVENKTPGIFILYAIANIFAPYNIVFVRIIGLLASLCTAIILHALCTKLYNKTAGIVCLYVFGLTLCWTTLDGYAFAQTETFMILFSTLSIYFLVISKANSMKLLFLAGLSAGLAITFKQIGITTCISLILIFLIYSRERNLRYKIMGIITIIFGVCVFILLSYVVLSIYNVSLYDYFEGAWLILFNSGSKVSGISIHLTNFVNAFFLSRLIIFYPILLLFFMQRNLLSKKIFMVLIIWFVFDFIGVNASGYYYGHQLKQLLPSLSIITSIGICYLINETHWAKIKSLNVRAGIIIILFVILTFPYKQIFKNINLLLEYNDKSPVAYLEIGNWINENSNEDDYIYIVGADQKLVQVLSISDRLSSSKYFHSIFITNDLQRQEVLKDLKKNPPAFILKHEDFEDDNIPKIYGNQLSLLMTTNYTLIKEMHNIEIFKLN